MARPSWGLGLLFPLPQSRTVSVTQPRSAAVPGPGARGSDCPGPWEWVFAGVCVVVAVGVAGMGPLARAAGNIPAAAWVWLPLLSWLPAAARVAAHHHRLRADGRSLHLADTMRRVMGWPWPGVSGGAPGGVSLPVTDLAGSPGRTSEWVASRGYRLAAAVSSGALAVASWAVILPDFSSVVLTWKLLAMVGAVGLAWVGSALGGFGPRELFAGALLTFGGVQFEAVVAAGLPLAAGQFSHAIFGFWAESRWKAALRRVQDAGGRPLSGVGSISVVMPVLNEAASLPEAIARARTLEGHGLCEIVVVDGGSRDSTIEVARGLGCRVLSSPPGRGGQLRAGAAAAAGDVILFLHADTWLEPGVGSALWRCLQDPAVVAGGFWKRFRDPPPLLRGSRPKCAVRVLVGRRIVGDMAMFVRRPVLERIGGVPDMELMEDMELSARLRGVGILALADGTVSTSARRFRQHGVLRTYWIMWKVTQLYRLGWSPARLRRLYERERA